MTYTPTDWVDHVTPVDASRMDHIEQGIADAHLGLAGAMSDLTALTVRLSKRGEINVKDYGAVGDGVTDDTAAIQAAADDSGAASPNGGILYFPATGTFYKVTDSIKIPANTKVAGGNWGGSFWQPARCKIKKTNGDTNDTCIFRLGINCLVMDIAFMGPDDIDMLASIYPAGTNNPSYGCLPAVAGAPFDPEGSTFFRCRFQNFKAAGLSGVFNAPLVVQCVFETNLFGIDWQANDAQVYQSFFRHQVHSGMRSANGFTRVAGNRFEWNSRHALILGTSPGVGGGQGSCVGNLFDHSGWAGLVLYNWFNLVTGNTFHRSGAGGDGVYGINDTAFEGDNAQITPTTGRDKHGNLIYLAPDTEHKKSHIYADAADHSTITGNMFVKNQGAYLGAIASAAPKYIFGVNATTILTISANSEKYGWVGSTPGEPAYREGPGAYAYLTNANLRRAQSGSAISLPFTSPVTADSLDGRFFGIPVSTTSPFTIAAPLNPTHGAEVTYVPYNTSGGAMGAITWDAVFRLAGAFVNPANGKRRSISFYWNGTVWIEFARSVADIG